MFSADAVQYVPLHRYESTARHDNITDWALKQFRAHYESAVTPAQAGVQTGQVEVAGADLDSRRRGNDRKPTKRITKEDIFHYCYAVLHDPVYREK